MNIFKNYFFGLEGYKAYNSFKFIPKKINFFAVSIVKLNQIRQIKQLIII